MPGPRPAEGSPARRVYDRQFEALHESPFRQAAAERRRQRVLQKDPTYPGYGRPKEPKEPREPQEVPSELDWRMPRDLECQQTGNPCGQDVWPHEQPCLCKSCRLWLGGMYRIARWKSGVANRGRWRMRRLEGETAAAGEVASEGEAATPGSRYICEQKAGSTDWVESRRWTALYLNKMEQTGDRYAACKAAMVRRKDVDRRIVADPEFKSMHEEAEDRYFAAMIAECGRRAVVGDPQHAVDKGQKGEVIGYKKSDLLMMFLIKEHHPRFRDNYIAPSDGQQGAVAATLVDFLAGRPLPGPEGTGSVEQLRTLLQQFSPDVIREAVAGLPESPPPSAADDWQILPAEDGPPSLETPDAT